MKRTVRILRHQKENLYITDKIAVMGFSAGAMICGNCAVSWDDGNSEAEDAVERESCRVDAAVIGYGAMSAVSFPRPFGHTEYTEGEQRLYGRDARERYALAFEKHISPDTTPMFIWQTLDDDGRYSLNLAYALQEAGVSYELHIFASGSHGTAMADGENDLGEKDDHTSKWGILCTEWLKEHLK